jgi:hypothetical protein
LKTLTEQEAVDKYPRHRHHDAAEFLEDLFQLSPALCQRVSFTYQEDMRCRGCDGTRTTLTSTRVLQVYQPVSSSSGRSNSSTRSSTSSKTNRGSKNNRITGDGSDMGATVQTMIMEGFIPESSHGYRSGSERRALALQHSVLGGACRAVHGHFRAHVGSVWVRAWDTKGPASCLGSP